MNNNYLFVYPLINYKKKGLNIYKFDGSVNLENFFYPSNKNLLSNSEYMKISKKSYQYIHRHIGTWQRWLINDGDEINKYRELHRMVLNIYIWLKEKKISKIIQFSGSPHHVDTVLIEIASRIYGVQSSFFYLDDVFTKTYIPMYRDEFKSEFIQIEKLKKSYKEIKKIISNFQEKLKVRKKADWIPRSFFYKKNILLAFLIIFYWYIKNNYLKINYNNFSEMDISLFGDIKSLIRQRKYLKILKKENHLNKFKIFPEKRNIIIYGHYQPESTTLSEGGEFRDQIDILKFLDRSGFKGNIFYKEHISSFLYIDEVVGATRVGLWKNKKFLNSLKKYNANLILDESDIKDPIIVTCTGSIAIERSLQGLRTVVCGCPWYGEIPGTIKIENINWDDKNSLDSFKIYSELVKNDTENYLLNLLSYGLNIENNQKQTNLSFSYSMKNFLDLFLET